jgi:hypothetical protein
MLHFKKPAAKSRSFSISPSDFVKSVKPRLVILRVAKPRSNINGDRPNRFLNACIDSAKPS